jgi:DMSO/TMAO reductase YedYZ molybdopterin-dependent catalytic subunit
VASVIKFGRRAIIAANAELQQSGITRHVCVEGGGTIGKSSGPRLADFPHCVGADPHAKYVGSQWAGGYYGGIDMQTALHPRTIIAVTFATATLPVEYDRPFELRIPTRLGLENPKW